MDLKKSGQFIAEKRKLKELSQKELAEKIGVTDKAVSRWETGRGFPDVSILENLADALDVSVVEIIKGEDSEGLITTENNVRQAISEIGHMAASKVRKEFGTIISCLLMLTMVGAMIFVIYDMNRDLYDDFSSEIPVVIYSETGDVIGEDTVTIKGELTKADAPERFGRIYKGEFSFESVFETQLKEVLIEFDCYEPGYHRLTYYRHGKAFINDEAIISRIYASRDMSQFAVRFTDGRVAATSENLAQVMLLDERYNLYM
ncbi:MAG: helix-turn-helix transcriptional regulator [Firmicutes bacterium]|nr:helix-turn-helix transcriptional regulator [Bacillota bacterium]